MVYRTKKKCKPQKKSVGKQTETGKSKKKKINARPKTWVSNQSRKIGQ